MTYQPKVYRQQGGDEIHIASGGLAVVESGGELRINAGATVTYPGSTAYSAGAKMPFWLELPILAQSTDGATVGSVTMVTPQKCEIIDVIFQKTGAGSSGTTVLTALVATSTDGGITDAVDMKVIVGTIKRPAKIVASLATRASGAVIKATRAGSSGTSVAGLNVEITVRVLCLPRATT